MKRVFQKSISFKPRMRLDCGPHSQIGSFAFAAVKKNKGSRHRMIRETLRLASVPKPRAQRAAVETDPTITNGKTAVRTGTDSAAPALSLSIKRLDRLGGEHSFSVLGMGGEVPYGSRQRRSFNVGPRRPVNPVKKFSTAVGGMAPVSGSDRDPGGHKNNWKQSSACSQGDGNVRIKKEKIPADPRPNMAFPAGQCLIFRAGRDRSASAAISAYWSVIKQWTFDPNGFKKFNLPGHAAVWFRGMRKTTKKIANGAGGTKKIDRIQPGQKTLRIQSCQRADRWTTAPPKKTDPNRPGGQLKRPRKIDEGGPQQLFHFSSK